jgi:hypothetical protein
MLSGMFDVSAEHLRALWSVRWGALVLRCFLGSDWMANLRNGLEYGRIL